MAKNETFRPQPICKVVATIIRLVFDVAPTSCASWVLESYLVVLIFTIFLFRYWLRESDHVYPESCLEIRHRGFHYDKLLRSGVYQIQPKRSNVVNTYCDFDRYDGGWTLILKSNRNTQWTKEESLENAFDPLGNKYSIFGFVDKIKSRDPAEVNFLNKKE